MRKFIPVSIAILLLFTVPACIFAQQESKPAEVQGHHFHLSFVTQELDENGKVTNARAYSTAIVAGNNIPGNTQIRTGDKIPVRTNDAKGEIQYIDIGVNFDCRQAKEVDGKLALHVDTEISSAVKTPSDAIDPIIRANRWGADVLVPIGKPTVIFASDNLESKGRIQVELTATRLE